MCLKKRPTGEAGFTLLELMLVVGVTGILAAIAIPSYQDYTVRAKITEGIIALSGPKAGVSDWFYTENSLPTSAQFAGVDLDPTSHSTDIIESLSVSEDGKSILTVAIRTDLDNEITPSSNKFSFVPNLYGIRGIKWKCRPGDQLGAESNSLEPKFLPGSCRGE